MMILILQNKSNYLIENLSLVYQPNNELQLWTKPTEIKK